MGDVGEGEGGGESGAFLQNALIHMHCAHRRMCTHFVSIESPVLALAAISRKW